MDHCQAVIGQGDCQIDGTIREESSRGGKHHDSILDGHLRR